jgi:predicted transcriptional regulator of viral defense system
MIVTTSMLKEKFHDYANPLDKIKRDADKGVIIRLVKGIYETDKNAEPCLLAASILSPSYLSFDWALSFYGLIPERVFAITSASLGLRKKKPLKINLGDMNIQIYLSRLFLKDLLILKIVSMPQK